MLLLLSSSLFIFPAVFFIVFAATVFAAIRSNKKARACLKEIAVHTGLDLIDGKPTLFAFMPNAGELTGHYASMSVRITRIVIRRGGRSSAVYFSRIRVACEGVPASVIRLKPERFMAKLNKLLGQKDVHTGDRRFDAMFMITSTAEDETQSWLNRKRREKIQQFFTQLSLKGFLEVGESFVSYFDPGDPRTHNDARRIIDILNAMQRYGLHEL